MRIDPRLNKIDDCLYRVAVRAVIVQDSKVLLVEEKEDNRWALPGGGVDYKETIDSTLIREIEEELDVPAKEVSCDFQIAYYNAGSVVNGIPRLNIYCKASVPKRSVRETAHVAKWAWFTREEFLKLRMDPSYDKVKLSEIIFSE